MGNFGLILYDSSDAIKNKWFIEKMQEECAQFDTTLKLIFCDYINDAYKLDMGSFIEKLILKKQRPDFVLNRSRSSAIAYHLEKLGIRVLNPANVTDICNDKDTTYQFVNKLGIEHLPYIVIDKSEYSPLCAPKNGVSITSYKEYENIIKKAEAFGYPFILKPSDGHGGKHVFLINNDSELKAAIKAIFSTYEKNPYRKLLIQKVADTIGRDLRVYILNNEIEMGMMRVSSSDDEIRANFSLGGIASRHSVDSAEYEIIKKITAAMPSDYIGIDFLYNNGRPVFNEIEDAVGARMVYANTDTDILKKYAEHIKNVIEKLR